MLIGVVVINSGVAYFFATKIYFFLEECVLFEKKML